MGFQNRVPPPLEKVSHRGQWVFVATFGGSVTSMAYFWGGSIEVRRTIALIGLGIIGVSALAFIRDWHFPFVRDRNQSPGIIDRRNKRRVDAANAVIFEEQRRVFEEQQRVQEEARADAERIDKAIKTWKRWGWHTNHREAIDYERGIRYPIIELSQPEGWDGSASGRWVAQCKVTFEGTTYMSGDQACAYIFGFSAGFPLHFPDSLECPLPKGTYEFEWECDHPILIERGLFEVGDNGVVLSPVRQ